MVRLLEKKKAKTSVLTIFAFTTFGLHLLALFILVLQGLNIRSLSLQKPPNFVQMIDGKTVDINKSNLEPEPETIRQFVNKTMTLMFNWSGKLPPQSIDEATQPKPDGGVPVPTGKGNQKISTTSWVAGFALSEDFRKGFLTKIAEMTPPEVFLNNPSQAISLRLAVKRIYPPKKIAPGKWQVGMVADLIQKKQSDNRSVIIPFNKDLLVRSVDTFGYPQTMKSDLQKAIYSVRADKLEIYEIRNLCLVDEYTGLSQDKSCGNLKNDQTFIK